MKRPAIAAALLAGVVAGCAILEAIMDIWPADRLGVADRGIREGILRGLISAGDTAQRLRTGTQLAGRR